VLEANASGPGAQGLRGVRVDVAGFFAGGLR
jgi:hypothetical protein